MRRVEEVSDGEKKSSLLKEDLIISAGLSVMFSVVIIVCLSVSGDIVGLLKALQFFMIFTVCIFLLIIILIGLEMLIKFSKERKLYSVIEFRTLLVICVLTSVALESSLAKAKLVPHLSAGMALIVIIGLTFILAICYTITVGIVKLLRYVVDKAVDLASRQNRTPTQTTNIKEDMNGENEGRRQ